MERMTERSEGNEQNEGGKKMHKFGKYWNCSAWNHLYTTFSLSPSPLPLPPPPSSFCACHAGHSDWPARENNINFFMEKSSCLH